MARWLVAYQSKDRCDDQEENQQSAKSKSAVTITATIAASTKETHLTTPPFHKSFIRYAFLRRSERIYALWSVKIGKGSTGIVRKFSGALRGFSDAGLKEMSRSIPLVLLDLGPWQSAPNALDGTLKLHLFILH